MNRQQPSFRQCVGASSRVQTFQASRFIFTRSAVKSTTCQPALLAPLLTETVYLTINSPTLLTLTSPMTRQRQSTGLRARYINTQPFLLYASYSREKGSSTPATGRHFFEEQQCHWGVQEEKKLLITYLAIKVMGCRK